MTGREGYFYMLTLKRKRPYFVISPKSFVILVPPENVVIIILELTDTAGLHLASEKLPKPGGFPQDEVIKLLDCQKRTWKLRDLS